MDQIIRDFQRRRLLIEVQLKSKQIAVSERMIMYGVTVILSYA